MRDYAELILDLRRHHCDAKEDDTQEVCEECAYDVIVADKSKFNGITDVCTCGLMHRAADAIEELHAKVPKQGEWLPHQNAQFIEADVCSVCGIGTRKMYHCTDGIQTWDEKPFFRYCPWCGAKLSEPPKGVE